MMTPNNQEGATAKRSGQLRVVWAIRPPAKGLVTGGRRVVGKPNAREGAYIGAGQAEVSWRALIDLSFRNYLRSSCENQKAPLVSSLEHSGS